MDKGGKFFMVLFGLMLVGGILMSIFSDKIWPEKDAGMSHMGTGMGQSPIQSHRSYALEVISNTDNIQPGKTAGVNYRVKNDQGEILKDFATVHEKIMHFIVVRKDLQEFQHLHPGYNQLAGEFSLNITFPTDGSYRIFPDFTPAKSADNPQLLPVTLYQDIVVGNLTNYKAQSVVADTNNIKTFGDYQITYAASKPLEAQKPVSYTLTVAKGGQPVKDLQPYLGAMGHSVILRADTLDFIHAHAESGRGTGPDISFSTTFPDAGVYKTFTQFQHQDKVLTSEYVLVVAPSTVTAPNNQQPEHGGGHQ